jgi:uncharacterized repeat protein (TIGR01451 family)
VLNREGVFATQPDFAGQPGTAMVGDTAPATEAELSLPHEVQIVRIQGPSGVVVEVLGPEPVPVPQGDGKGLATLGMRVGVSYQLRLSNLPNREEAELFPVIQLVGHLHRPPGIDPARYPIRVQLSEEDIDNVLRNGRLVTEVVYLEDPDLAVPIHFPKEEIPVVTLSPAEDPVKVAAALGRPMVLLQIGTRAPLASDLFGGAIFPLNGTPCPFVTPVSGSPCGLPCGPCAGTPPPANRPWMPRDEFLCDGGDFGKPAAFAGDGGLAGIDPRDAVVRFHADRSRKPRVLPTNLVCIYAPRFAAVRRPYGATEYKTVENLYQNNLLQRQQVEATRQRSRRFNQNLSAQGLRDRSRASELAKTDKLISFTELRVLSGLDASQHIRGNVDVQGPQVARVRSRASGIITPTPPLGIKTVESAVITGIVQGANEQVMAWKPQESVGVEEPPNKPGLAVIKMVDTDQAEPGDVVTYTIKFRNMGNVPIRAVSIVDNLLPRLEYEKGSAQGPVGAVFTATGNEVGSSELRWDLPGALAPGTDGEVSFRARVR